MGDFINTRLLFLSLLAFTLLSCTASVGPLTSFGNVPPQFFLDQNFPNPFTDSTSIPYGVPENGGFVTLQIFDKYHNLVRVLAYNVSAPPGSFTEVWDGRNTNYDEVPPGIYVVELYGSSPNTFISRIAAVKIR
ncbi:MAG: FlgD immunoglobulin-like domain containing protein [Bacteroidota bacterium]